MCSCMNNSKLLIQACDTNNYDKLLQKTQEEGYDNGP
jgi:hypothetical protein